METDTIIHKTCKRCPIKATPLPIELENNLNLGKESLQLLNYRKTLNSTVDDFNKTKEITKKNDIMRSTCDLSNYTTNESVTKKEEPRYQVNYLDLLTAHQELIKEFNKLKGTFEQLTAENRTLKHEKNQLELSIKNLKNQLGLFLSSFNNKTTASDILITSEIQSKIQQIKAEADQRVNFIFKKIETYIIKVDKLEATINDLHYEYRRIINGYQADNNYLRLKLNQKQVYIERTAKKKFQPKICSNRIATRNSIFSYNETEFDDCSGARSIDEICLRRKLSYDNHFIDYDKAGSMEYSW